MKSKSYELYAVFFETLAAETRLRLINSLRTGPKNVTQLIKETGIEQSCTSHCLKRLEDCGFVTVRREGKFRVYELNHTTIEPLMELVDKHTQMFCARRKTHEAKNHH
jgi:DNA-binding transcriptional ArsR family regulator